MSSEIVKTLDDYVDKVITIKLRNDSIIRATLQGFDPQMNLILTNTKDITDNDKNLDDVILRVDNIIMLSLDDE